jgi:peptidoglycan/LPS O-acetylase OafA/YrhL
MAAAPLGLLGTAFHFGQEAVIVFFLLSGFVIFANEQGCSERPGGYYLRRLRRIYPALLAAMACSTLVALANHNVGYKFRSPELWATILSVQDIAVLKPGVIADPYMGNEPLWSLSYEVLFYLVFPGVLLLWKRWPKMTNHLVGSVCCALYLAYAARPGHFTLVGAYFLVWWTGAMVASAYGKGARNLGAIRSTLGWLLALNVVAAVVVWRVGYVRIGVYPFLPLVHFLTAALVVAASFGPLGRRLAQSLFPRKAAFAWIASISYGLYVLHFPLLVQWQFASSPVGWAAAIALLIGGSILVDRILPRLLPRAPSA